MAWYLYMAKKRPSFILGIASLFDFFGILNSCPKMGKGEYKPIYDDSDAIASDWKIVGNDIHTAMTQFDQAGK